MGSFLCGIRQRPTLPGRLQPSTIGAERLNFCVRYGNRWDPFAIITGMPMKGLCSPLSSWFRLRPFLTEASFLETLRTIRAFLLFTRTLKTAHPDFLHLVLDQSLFNFPFGLTRFSISLDQVLDRLVSASFYVTAFTPLTYLLVVFQGSYFFRMGHFFLRWASRLDAFSVYPLRISLPSCALGRTTVAPVMRPLRSSRTRSSSSHVSFAHDG